MLKDFYAGLEILMKYYPNTEVSAGHDVIYCGGDSSKMTSEEFAHILTIPRWHYSTAYDCFYFNT